MDYCTVKMNQVLYSPSMKYVLSSEELYQVQKVCKPLCTDKGCRGKSHIVLNSVFDECQMSGMGSNTGEAVAFSG